MSAPRRITAGPRAARLRGGLLVTLVLASCGREGDGRACAPVQREALDPAYLVHVVGTDTAVEYATDPPTSGPHQSGPAIEGVLDEPLTRPVQVGILERGDVVIQHDPALAADDLEALRGLAAERVVIAPNPDLPDTVVATAWVHKLACSAVDAAALRGFVEDRAGKGPEG